MICEKVKLSLHLSAETNDLLEKMCKEGHMTKSELLRKSVALMEVALKYKKQGNHLAVIDDEGHKISEIVGL